MCNDRSKIIDNLASEVWKATELCKVDASDATFAKVQPAPPSQPWKRWCRILRLGPRWRRPAGTLASCCSSWEFPVDHCCTPRLAHRLIQNQCHETPVFRSPSGRNHKGEQFETLWWMRPPFSPSPADRWAALEGRSVEHCDRVLGAGRASFVVALPMCCFRIGSQVGLSQRLQYAPPTMISMRWLEHFGRVQPRLLDLSATTRYWS